MPRQIQVIIVGLLILILSVFVGHAVASAEYDLLVVFLVFFPLAIAAVIYPGYEFFLAFGLLCPFAFPIPFVSQFPLFALILGFCCFKLAFSRGMDKTRLQYHKAFNLLTVVFFGWIALRYCMNPVLPGLAIGRGSSITGFRGYLSYGICFLLVVTLPLFIRDREEISKLVRWMGVISISLVAVFIPLTFTKSFAMATILSRLGLNMAFFDNGWLRFITLPGFGLLLVILTLLPRLFPLRQVWRIILLCTGFLAIVMGGNRSTVAMAFVAVLAITIVRRRLRVFLGATIGIVLCLLLFRYIGENAKFENGVGFFRVLALVSNRVARDTDAEASYEWRKVRWELAMIEIRKHPWIGVAYGGLDAVFAVATSEDWAQNSAEIDVAAGSIHNGYIAGARAFGIPFSLLFSLLLLSRIFAHWRQAVRERNIDPLQSDLHTFILANLAGLPIGIYIGIDLNQPSLWFYIALGFIICKLEPREATSVTQIEAEPEPHSPPGKLIHAPIRSW